MNFYDRMDASRVTPGTLTTARYRTRLLMRLYRAGGVPQWVERALRAQLPVSVVGATLR